MQLNELKELYKKELIDDECDFELDGMEQIEDMVLDSSSIQDEDYEYKSEIDNENMLNKNDMDADYITEEALDIYDLNEAHDDVQIIDDFVKHEASNICDDSSCHKESDSNVSEPGIIASIRRFFQPLFAIVP